MKPWKILYRQNQNPIEMATVQRQSIPDDVAPVLGAFVAHHVNDDPPLGAGETAQGVVGSIVWFYIEYTDPDNAVYEFVLGYDGDAEGADIETYDKSELISCGSGFLFSYAFQEIGTYYPEIMLKWRDHAEAEQNVQMEMTNPPVEIDLVTASVAPTDCMIGDTVTLTFNTPDEVDSTIIEWGDE